MRLALYSCPCMHMYLYLYMYRTPYSTLSRASLPGQTRARAYGAHRGGDRTAEHCAQPTGQLGRLERPPDGPPRRLRALCHSAGQGQVRSIFFFFLFVCRLAVVGPGQLLRYPLMRLYLFLRVILRRKFGTALRYFEEMRDHFTKQPRFVWDVLIQSLARDFRVGPALELLVWLRDRSR